MLEQDFPASVFGPVLFFAFDLFAAICLLDAIDTLPEVFVDHAQRLSRHVIRSNTPNRKSFSYNL
jgi:hypothetical protein